MTSRTATSSPAPARKSGLRHARTKQMAGDWRKRLLAWSETPLPEESFQLQVWEDALIPAGLLRLAAARKDRMLLLVLPDEALLEKTAQHLGYLFPLIGETRPVIPIPALSPNRRSWIPENEASLSAALEAALSRKPAVFLATAQVLLEKTLPPQTFQAKTLTLKPGETIRPEQLAEMLAEMDYDNEAQVSQPGEFSRRGGIFDIYSPLYEQPVRLEFFGDTIDEMRFFLPDTQRSTGPAGELQIIPRGASLLENSDSRKKTAAIRSFFPPEIQAILVNPGDILRHLQEFSDTEHIRCWKQMQKEWQQPVTLQANPGDAEAARRAEDGTPIVTLEAYSLGTELSRTIPELAKEAALWHWQQLQSSLQLWKQDGYDIIACCAESGEAERLQQLMRERGELPLQILQQNIGEGLLLPEAKLALLSTQELFGRKDQRRKRRQLEYTRGDFSLDREELEEGRYVVHVAHGIALYHGVRTTETNGELHEVMSLEFADGNYLYVPLAQSFLVSPYHGAGKAVPKLSRLGSAAWKHARKKAEEAAFDLAAELIRMEAVREQTRGCAMRPVPEWEIPFAHSFPWIETPDQAKAIQAVLADMEQEKPMDRLLCGDVGYGKTEVAIRAAFRAVLNEKQVAVLVPTTILALQHYQSFKERMAEYPVTIAMLSRFQSPAEIRSIRERLATGEIDILIGAHAILAPSLHFRRLGLLVIDEEQRFGVRHKQQLKEMRAALDILTMSATPIPRTLYFSLSGIRNLSTIMTAPVNRLPVSTTVTGFDPEQIRQAILRELQRKGQVFFLHNRVQTIQKTADFIQSLVPQAKCAVAHGQMSPEELEELMTRFVRQEFDVLICTTIIESGMDIPNVNTILIDRADRFGLSELYQLRGRVGRTDRQAYAYLLLPSVSSLTRDARERMAAIRRYNHLGAGFRLAMRDLEIRGAGNILGAEQSGHIAAVGFDLYCQLLQNAVNGLSGFSKLQTNALHCEIALEHLSFALRSSPGHAAIGLPLSYVPDVSLRIQIYRRLESLQKERDLLLLREELRDRFGKLPEETEGLLTYHQIRLLATARGIFAIRTVNDKLLMETPKGLLRMPDGTLPLLQGWNGRNHMQQILQLLQRISPDTDVHTIRRAT